MLILFEPAEASFSALYVFGDGICTTTNHPTGSSEYYGGRYCNGRVWVEVLAQRQGIPIALNWSYFGQDSGNLVKDVGQFVAPPYATNGLFVVWANDADFVGYLQNNLFGPPYNSSVLQTWTNAMNVSLTNHFAAITNLYAKGARTLIMPNAVDLMEVPLFDNTSSNNLAFVRQRTIEYNSAFTNILNKARAQCPGLTIYVPDIFSLLDNVITNAARYGVTNATYNQGNGFVSIDAITYYGILGLQAATNGLGTNFIFWDNLDPTAAMQEVLADYVQQIISPASIGRVAALNGSNRLDVVNVPVGLSGSVQACTNLGQPNWTVVQGFTSTNVAQSTFVKPSGPQQFYRLRFPYAWSWP